MSTTDERVAKFSEKLEYIRGMLESTLPRMEKKLSDLPTKQDLELELIKHKESCELKPSKQGRKKLMQRPIGMAGALVALAGAGYALADVLKGFF